MANIQIYKGQSVVLSGSESYDPDGTIVSYLWSTGETTISITVSPEVTTTYTLTVKDNDNATDTTTFTVEVITKPSDISLVCYKGDSIIDKLIRIVRKHYVPKYHCNVPRKHILVEHTDSYCLVHPEPEQTIYTHVGIALNENITDTEVKYMASREDAGVLVYTADKSDVDIYPIYLKDSRIVLPYFDKTFGTSGSMIADMGYPNLKAKGTIGSEEWVARALGLGIPERYTQEDLIRFANMQ